MAEPIGFSITAPTSFGERLVSLVYGGMGMVHEFLGWMAFNRYPELYERLESLKALGCTPTLFVAGVIYNDFPAHLVDPGNTQAYVRDYLEPVLLRDAPYIQDARFRWQPRADLRYANAVEYKNFHLLDRLLRISPEVLATARVMLKDRTLPERTHYHFMRTSRRDTVENVRERAIQQAELWMTMALHAKAVFYVGNICHMVMDSFSPAHVKRSPSLDDPNRPYGLVYFVEFFPDQTEHSHSVQESWRAVSTPGSDAARYAEWCVPALAEIVTLFLEHAESGDYAAALPRLRTLLEERVFAMDNWERAAARPIESPIGQTLSEDSKPGYTRKTPSAPIPVTLERVVDGDTVVVRRGPGKRGLCTVRLMFIDAPEMKQYNGPEARDKLEQLLFGSDRPLFLITYGTDKYWRTLGELRQWLSATSFVSVNMEMVNSGHAWHYAPKGFVSAFPDEDALYAAAQRAASGKRVGIWSNIPPEGSMGIWSGLPMPPWEWRAEQKQKKRAAGGGGYKSRK